MKNAIIGLFVLFVGSASASDCPQFYPHSKPIVVKDTVELCSSFFVTVYSTKLKAPLFSSAIVSFGTPSVERVNAFRADTRIAPELRAENSDYSKSGFDRGHLTAAGDADTIEEMRDTFLLTNMVPQIPKFNRVDWRALEMSSRKIMKFDTHIVTGAIYSKAGSTIGANKIPVPIGLYKIVYTESPMVYYSENISTPLIRTITFAKIKSMSGIKFPTMP